MTILISIVLLVLVSSIYGDFDTTHDDLEIIRSPVDMNNQSKSIFNIDMKLAADNIAANQSPGSVKSTVDSDSPQTTSDATIDYREITTTKSNTASIILRTGEPPPTRSAQLGMGLGISLVGLVIVIEIIYFKRFYRGGLDTDAYLA